MSMERSYESTARKIEAQIRRDGLLPGDAIPAEMTLATDLGVNRSTVREALRALEQAGIVMRETGRKRLRVSPPRADHASERVASVLVRQNITFRELYEAMAAVEPACAIAAAERIQQEQIAAIEANLAQTHAAVADGTSLVALDIEFHQLVAEAAHSRALELARAPIGSLFYPAFEQVMLRLNVADRLLTAHQEIFNAIRDGDAEGAGLWMKRHIEDFRRGCELAGIDMERSVTL